jgi:hypothetical protein
MKVSETRWGQYKSWEGPWTPGTCAVLAPANPTEDEKVLLVVTATEGGKWDAVNAYDRMILSVGAVQWGECGQFSVSDLLGKVAERDPSLLDPLAAAMEPGMEFKRNGRGRWRFYLPGNDEVDTVAKQQTLFLRCDGLRGSWGPPEDPRRLYARTWVAAIASVFEQPAAQEAQASFTVPRLRGFAMPNARAALWGPGTPADNSGWAGALRAGYLSFAANLPAVAGEQLRLALDAMGDIEPWSEEWAIRILHQLTLGPNIGIYTDRYRKIRPVLEALYEITLPDLPSVVPPSALPGIPSFLSLADVQTELLAQGYDLGPGGADGKMGPKTLAALKDFQGKVGLTADGQIGPATRAKLQSFWAAAHGA